MNTYLYQASSLACTVSLSSSKSFFGLLNMLKYQGNYAASL